MLGVLLALGAAIGFGATGVTARLSVEHMRPTTGTLLSLMVGGAVVFVIAAIVSGISEFKLEPIAYVWLCAAGISSFVVGRLLNFVAVSRIGVSRSAPLVGTSPVFAATAAVLFAGESLNTLIIVGTLAIIGGLAIVVRQ